MRVDNPKSYGLHQKSDYVVCEQQRHRLLHVPCWLISLSRSLWKVMDELAACKISTFWLVSVAEQTRLNTEPLTQKTGFFLFPLNHKTGESSIVTLFLCNETCVSLDSMIYIKIMNNLRYPENYFQCRIDYRYHYINPQLKLRNNNRLR